MKIKKYKCNGCMNVDYITCRGNEISAPCLICYGNHDFTFLNEYEIESSLITFLDVNEIYINFKC